MTSILVSTAELHAAGYIGERTYGGSLFLIVDEVAEANCGRRSLSCGPIPDEPAYAVAVELPVVEDDFVGPLS